MNDIGSHNRSASPYYFFSKSHFQTKRAAKFHSPLKVRAAGFARSPGFFMGYFALTSMPSYQDNEPPGCCGRGGALCCISKMSDLNWVNHFFSLLIFRLINIV
jgi:hypothetical protein